MNQASRSLDGTEFQYAIASEAGMDFFRAVGTRLWSGLPSVTSGGFGGGASAAGGGDSGLTFTLFGGKLSSVRRFRIFGFGSTNTGRRASVSVSTRHQSPLFVNI